MRALVPVATGSEDIEFVAVVDILSRAGVDVVTASVEQDCTVRLMKGVTIHAACRLDAVADEMFDAVILPGGVPGAMRLAESRELRKLLIRHHQQGALIGAICLAPALVLKPAGILDASLQVTGNPRPIATPTENFAADTFTALLGSSFDANARVCVDEENRIITSQAPGTAIEFALAAVRMLQGEQVAQKIADYILA